MRHSTRPGTIIATGLVLILMISTANALFLEKRSALEVAGGWWNEANSVTASVGPTGQVTTAANDGGRISLGYVHWPRENLGLNISVGLLRSSADVRIIDRHFDVSSVNIIPIMLGIRYYLPPSTFSTSWRPYLTAGIGPVIGTVSKTAVNLDVIQESQSAVAFGSFLGAGLNIGLSRYFIFESSLGYRIINDFSETIAGRDNYSGPEINFGLGLLLNAGLGN